MPIHQLMGLGILAVFISMALTILFIYVLSVLTKWLFRKFYKSD